MALTNKTKNTLKVALASSKAANELVDMVEEFDSGILPLTVDHLFTPAGPTIVDAQYRWVKRGKVVDLSLFIKLDQLNNGFNYINFDFPADMPLPMTWDGLEVDDSLFTGSIMTGNYEDGGYSFNGKDLFQINLRPDIDIGYGLWIVNLDGTGINRDRIFASIRYITA